MTSSYRRHWIQGFGLVMSSTSAPLIQATLSVLNRVAACEPCEVRRLSATYKSCVILGISIFVRQRHKQNTMQRLEKDR
jgi:hypothetical protein